MRLPGEIRDAMVTHARFCAPLEACGLLAVDEAGELRMAYCLTNADASPRRFTVAPAEHYRALRHAERYGWRIGGAFHSHPRAPAWPSPADVAGALDPGWLHVIVSLLAGTPTVNAFCIRDGVVAGVPLEVAPRRSVVPPVLPVAFSS